MGMRLPASAPREHQADDVTEVVSGIGHERERMGELSIDQRLGGRRISRRQLKGMAAADVSNRRVGVFDTAPLRVRRCRWSRHPRAVVPFVADAGATYPRSALTTQSDEPS